MSPRSQRAVAEEGDRQPGRAQRPGGERGAGRQRHPAADPVRRRADAPRRHRLLHRVVHHMQALARALGQQGQVEALGQAQRVLGVALHADVERLHAPEDEEGVHGGGDGADGVLEEAEPLVALAGQYYPVIKTGPSPSFFRSDEAISRLLSDQSLPHLLANLDSLAKGASDTLDEENRAALKRTIRDLSDVVHAVAAHKTQIEQSLNGAARSADNLAKLTAALNEEIPVLLTRINKSATALNTMTEDLAQTSKAVRSVVNDNRSELERFSRHTLPEAGALVVELRQLAGALGRVARDLEREPNSLVFGKTPPPKGPGE